jgi:hypothetical protein
LGSRDDSEGKRVKLVCAYSDERTGRNRSITDVDWSPKAILCLCGFGLVLMFSIQYPELSVASYNKNPAALNEPDGIVAVWNLHMLERPEFVFHSQVGREYIYFVVIISPTISIVRRALRNILPIPFKPRLWRDLLWSNLALGYTL